QCTPPTTIPIASPPLDPRSPPFPSTTLFRSGRGAFENRRRRIVERLVDMQCRNRFRGRCRHNGQDERRAESPEPKTQRHRHEPSDRKSTRLNSSHVKISYAVFCLKKKKQHSC